MENIIEIKNLTKSYKTFTLDHVSFALPYGSIMGLIGENGAGKTTMIDSILGITPKDEGSITIFGEHHLRLSNIDKEKIGVVLDEFSYHRQLTPIQINHVLKNIYTKWNEDFFLDAMRKYKLPLKQQTKKYSHGMRKQLSILCAMAHMPQLLILDEATSGLDPIMRDDILDMLLDFIQDEKHSVLMSTHIVSDLEKVADYITFIKEGELIFTTEKNHLLENQAILRCQRAQFEMMNKDNMLAYRIHDYHVDVLIADRNIAKQSYPKIVVDHATIEEIMLIYTKGVRV